MVGAGVQLRVLGIDPGTYKMGVGVLDSEDGVLSLAHSTVLAPPRKDPIAQRLEHLYQGLLDVITEWQPSAVAIEEPFVSRNVRSALAVGQAQAVAMMAAAHNGLPVAGYAPRQVKQAVSDYGGSSKEQVHEMVRVHLGLSEPLESSDAADALAVAICHVNASNAEELTILD